MQLPLVSSNSTPKLLPRKVKLHVHTKKSAHTPVIVNLVIITQAVNNLDVLYLVNGPWENG